MPECYSGRVQKHARFKSKRTNPRMLLLRKNARCVIVFLKESNSTYGMAVSAKARSFNCNLSRLASESEFLIKFVQ